MSEQQREILERVARGDITPETAAELLARLEHRAEEPPPEAHAGSFGAVARVKVVGSFRTTKIIGDPDVREVSVEGPHVVRREGDLIVIEDDRPRGDDPESAHAYAFATGKHAQAFRFSIGGKKHTLFESSMGSKPKPLEIRMNPTLPLEVELAAGTLHVRGVRAPISADVSAGTARIEGLRSPVQVSVAAGSAHLSGLLDHGDSRVRCEAGAIRIQLEKGSSVRMSVRATLGRVNLPDRSVAGVSLGSETFEHTIGDGAGTLDIETNFGKVDVSVDATAGGTDA